MLEQQTRTCSDKQKEAAESSVRPFENLCFCVSEEVTVPKKKQKNLDGWRGWGLYVNQPHDPRQNNEKRENKSKESKAAAALIGSPLIWSTVQGYRVSYCKNLNKSEGKRQS